MLRIFHLATALAAAGFLAPLAAAVIEFNPDRLVTLELSNGNTVTGRIIEVQADRLHLVRAGFNKMIAFQDLSPAGRKSLGLPESLPATGPAPAASAGLHITRDRLLESLDRLEAARHSAGSSWDDQPWAGATGYWPALAYPISGYYPWHPHCQGPVHGGGWHIQIKF